MVLGAQDIGGDGTTLETPSWLSLHGPWAMGPVTFCQANTVPLSLVFGCLPLPFSLQAVASAAQASLLRQQEELDRKAAELERKEQELQNTVANLHGKGGHTRSWVSTLVQESSLSLLVPRVLC